VGYLSEVHGHGMNEQAAADMSEDLAAGMLGTTLGLKLTPTRHGLKRNKFINPAA